MAPHSSTLAWKIPWMEEPGRLQSMGSLGVGCDWVTSLSLFTFMHWRRKWQPTPVFLPAESQGRGSLVGCPSMGSHRVGYDWSDLAAATEDLAVSHECHHNTLMGRDLGLSGSMWEYLHKDCCEQRGVIGQEASENTGVTANAPVCWWCWHLHFTHSCEQLDLLYQTTQLVESLSWLECNPSNPLVSVSVAQEDQRNPWGLPG